MGQTRVKARRYRIFQLSAFDCLTVDERLLYDSYLECKGKKVKPEKRRLFIKKINEFNGVRSIPDTRLRVKNADGTLSDKYRESIQNPMFEGEMARLANDFKESYPLVKEIVYFECSILEILKQIIDNGIIIEGEKYIFFSATTNMMKKNMIILLKENFYEENESKIMCGLSRDKINKGNDRIRGCNRGKYLAYTSLPMSASVEVSTLNTKDEKFKIDIDDCIVVPDFEGVLHEKVNFLDVNTLKAEVMEKDIPIPFMDGAGIFLPNAGIMPRTGQIRGGFFKGCLFPFDFRAFIESREDSDSEITDVYGDKINVLKEGIKVIFTASQFKMWKYYANWKEFKKAFKANGCQICINNLAHTPSENAEVCLTYQFLQTLPKDKFSDEAIVKLCEKTVDKLKNARVDLDKALELLGISEEKELKPLYAAILLYPQLVNDKSVKKMIAEKINTVKKNAMGGKILVDGFYTYICPDLYAFCENLFCGIENPKGLIPREKVYNAYYNDKEDVTEVDCLRSPHLGDSEHCIRQLHKSKECQTWFRGYDTVISNHDLITKHLMCDVDGDEMLITSSKELISLVDKEKPALYYDMEKADAEQITDEVLFECLVSSFENSIIGNISNAITKLYSVNGKIDCKLIRVLTAYNNYMIDYPKTQKAMDLQQYKESYEALLDKKSKLPYFFIYAKKKSATSVAEPTDCNVDKVCKYIQTNVKNTRFKIFAAKDSDAVKPEMLSDSKIKVDRTSDEYKRLLTLLEELHYKAQSVQKYTKRVRSKLNGNKGIDEDALKIDLHYYLCREAITGIFGKNGITHETYLKAASYLVDAEYYQYEFKTFDKKLIWNCFGEEVYENIKKNLNSDKQLKRRRNQYQLQNADQYKKIKEAVADVNEEIKIEKESKENVVIHITDKEMSWIDNIEYKKNCKTDKQLLFILLYLQKKYSKDGVFKLYANKKSGITASTIDKWIGSDICKKGIKRLVNLQVLDVENISNRYGKYMNICVNIPQFENVNDLFCIESGNPLIALCEYTGKPKVKKCEICNNKFIAVGNSKTCGSLLCKRKLEKKTKDECNKKQKEN